jgi:G3E family GTPase
MTHNTITAVPTNIITGFLGVGKTSTILYLLKNKPINERWAILVNEFGEIGIDGSLLEGQYTENESVFIREVPGGCMCCAAGVPMQVALNQLLARAKPDRLLIEPTGLGHPKEVLKIITEKQYQKILSIEKIITLVDARNLADERYTSHDIFNQQIAIADIIMGNKVELYQKTDKALLKSYVKNHGKSQAKVIFPKRGGISISQLIGKTNNLVTSRHHHHAHHTIEKADITELPIPECGYIKAVNMGEGFDSIGWRFTANTIFCHSKLIRFFNKTKAIRIKAVLTTDLGIIGYNLSENKLTETKLSTIKENRIEIISQQINNTIENELMACINC